MDNTANPAQPPSIPTTSRATRRAAVTGFIVGGAITPVILVLALMVPVVEALLPLLTPGTQLLRPLTPAMSTWPGVINIILASVANGLVFALLAGGVALLLGRRRVDAR